VAQSNEAAAQWFKKAAEQGDAQAQHSLELMFASGRGVAQSDLEAAKWHKRAADQGYAPAQGTQRAERQSGSPMVKTGN
jgi:TPR repeat protein